MTAATIDQQTDQTLTPHMPVGEAARKELRSRIRTVERLLKQTRSDGAGDARKVHQLRVAIRRASAALAVFQSCVKRRPAKKTRAALRGIRQMASESRQCDVHLDLLKQWQDSPGAEHHPLMLALDQVIREERSNAQKLIVRMARQGKAMDLRRCRRKLIASLVDDQAGQTVAEVARQAIARRGGEFTDAAKCDLSDLQNLHIMRVAGKRLRYALEILEPALPAAATIARERVEQLQDRLGHVNDLAEFNVRLQSLQTTDALAKTNAEHHSLTAADGRSMLSHLIEDVQRQLHEHHESFLREWSRGDWSDLVRAMTALGGSQTESTTISSTPPPSVDESRDVASAAEAHSPTNEPIAPPPIDVVTTKRIAAIDVGTNSIRLVIAEVSSDGRLRVIDDEKAMTRLGQGLARTGKLAAKAMDESAMALSQFKAIAEGYRVDALKAVATCAVREARNGREFVNMVKQRAGVKLEVISAQTEARLAFRSVSNAFDLRATRTAVVDIGGGSTEIILGSGNLIEQIYPIPLGAVRLTEKFRIADDVPEERYQRMRDLIRKTLRAKIGRLPFIPHLVIGTGGTFTALAAMAIQRGLGAQNSEFLPFTVRGYEMQRSELKHILDHLRDLSLNGRLRVPGVSPERADIIVAGVTIIDCVLKELQVNTLRVHDQGIRAGLLHSMADELFPAADRPEALQPDRIREVRQFAIACNFEQSHAEHVSSLSVAIFDQLASELGEKTAAWATPENRELLHAGALVHDVGYFINYSKHHKHSYHLVMHSDLDAFTHRQREIIANIARYHRGATPKKSHANLARLSKKDRDLLCRLSAILRIADGLDRSHTQQVKSIELHCHDGVAFMRLESTGDATVDVWGSMRKGRLFEKMFGLKVRFSCVNAGTPHAETVASDEPAIESGSSRREHETVSG